MDLIFCGTPEFAVPTLDALVAAGHAVRLVVSQPDRVSGRGQQLSTGAVKRRAIELGIPVAQPEKIKSNDGLRQQVSAIAPQAIVVVAYGRLIPKWMLDSAPLGNINLHGSLLPKYRGAAPIQWAIANGETTTGVTTMLLNEGLDTGDILLQETIAIAPEDTALTISPRLAKSGAGLLVKTLACLESKSLRPRPQDHSQASLASILTREDGRIDFRRAAAEILNRLRGFQPWPGAFTTFRGKNLRIISARAHAPAAELIPPGRLKVRDQALLVGCGHDTLELLQLQPEGKSVMAAGAFISGYRPLSGEALGV